MVPLWAAGLRKCSVQQPPQCDLVAGRTCLHPCMHARLCVCERAYACVNVCPVVLCQVFAMPAMADQWLDAGTRDRAEKAPGTLPALRD